MIQVPGIWKISSEKKTLYIQGEIQIFRKKCVEIEYLKEETRLRSKVFSLDQILNKPKEKEKKFWSRKNFGHKNNCG